jgi:hypothetical protein
MSAGLKGEEERRLKPEAYTCTPLDMRDILCKKYFASRGIKKCAMHKITAVYTGFATQRAQQPDFKSLDRVGESVAKRNIRNTLRASGLRKREAEV